MAEPVTRTPSHDELRDDRPHRIALALEQLDLGFALFPTRPDKRPITEHGFKNATTDPSMVTTFLGNPGITSYGMVVPAGSDINALDVDGEDWRARMETLTLQAGVQWPRGRKTKSPNGYHLFFRSAQVAAGPGNDLFGFVCRKPDKGYVIGPGSVTEGGFYELRDGELGIPQLPAEWEGLQPLIAPVPTALITTSMGFTLAGPYGEGQRYDAIRGYTGHLYNLGLGEPEIWALVQSYLMPMFSPQKPVAEVRSDFDRCLKDLPSRFGPPAISLRAAPRPTVEQRQTTAVGQGALRIAGLDSYEDGEMDWYWSDFLPRGGVTVFDGDPGMGKSAITIDILARLSRASAWLDGSPGPATPVRSLYITAEDDPGMILKPRLLAAGGDPALVMFAESKFILPDDALVLHRTVLENNLGMVVIDPLFGHIDEEVKTISDSSMRQNVMDPLHKVAHDLNIAILVIRHNNKSAGSSAIHRGAGSLGGVVGKARMGWTVAHDPDNAEGDSVRAWGPYKTNYSHERHAYRYRMEGVLLPGRTRSMAKVDWIAEATYSINDIMDDQEPEKTRNAADELADILAGAVMVSSTEVQQRMAAKGFKSRATVGRAARRIGATLHRQGFGPGSKVLYALPSHTGSAIRMVSMVSKSGGQPNHTDHTDHTVDVALSGSTMVLPADEPIRGPKRHSVHCLSYLEHLGAGKHQRSRVAAGRWWCSACCEQAELDAEMVALADGDPELADEDES